MNLFAGIKYGKYTSPDANFDGFWLTLLTMFRYVPSVPCALVCMCMLHVSVSVCV